MILQYTRILWTDISYSFQLGCTMCLVSVTPWSLCL